MAGVRPSGPGTRRNRRGGHGSISVDSWIDAAAVRITFTTGGVENV